MKNKKELRAAFNRNVPSQSAISDEFAQRIYDKLAFDTNETFFVYLNTAHEVSLEGILRLLFAKSKNAFFF